MTRWRMALSSMRSYPIRVLRTGRGLTAATLIGRYRATSRAPLSRKAFGVRTTTDLDSTL